MPKDYYAILGVSRSADEAAIHSAFRALARRYHPDVGRGASANKFREALEAYEALSDPARRQQHDLDLSASVRRRADVVAEPLFQKHRSPVHGSRARVFNQEDLFLELFQWIESEFDGI
jgi:DnaJ-class molecular chaperone